jgi:hypothetical protein
VSIRNVDFASLRKRLAAQNVPLPDAYPAKYAKNKKGPVRVYEALAFGEKMPTR